MLKVKDLKQNYIRIILWAMFGMITSIIIACMLLVGSVNIEKFYNVGECYDFYSMYIEFSGSDVEYDSETHIFTVTDERPHNTVKLMTELREWKYIYFDVTETGEFEKIDATIEYYAENDTVGVSQEIQLHNGENEVQVPTGISFNKIVVLYNMEEGDCYGINNIEFMESKKPFTIDTLI